MTKESEFPGKLKALIRERFPLLRRVLRWSKVNMLQFGHGEPVFQKIYSENFWEDSRSRSGPGSTLARTKALRRKLKALTGELGAKSLLDIPCGDFNWLKEVDLDVDYLGADVVPELIDRNIKNYGNARRRFVMLDILKDRLPRADMVFCRDLLVHFNNRHVLRAVKNIRHSNSKYLLATTYPGLPENENIVTGEWRALDMCKPPFSFPSPIMTICEDCPEEKRFSSLKSLGLWKVADL